MQSSTEAGTSKQLADADLLNAYRKARVDALSWQLEYTRQAWEISQLLAARIKELLSIPAVTTISKPGREPEIVPRRSGAAYPVVASLIGTYVLLKKSVLTPLPAESVVETALAGNADLKTNQPKMGEVQEARPDPTAEASQGSDATECNILQQNSAPISEPVKSSAADEPSRKVA